MMTPVALAGPFDARPWLEKAKFTQGPIDSLVGIGGTPVCLLAEAILATGDPLLVVTLDPGIQEEVILEGPSFRICVGPYRSRSRERWMDAFATEVRWIAATLRREGPRLVHAHWTYEYALGALDSDLAHLITARDAPWVILGLQIRHHPRGFPYRAVRTAMAYQVLRRARNLTAVSQYVVDHLHRFGFTQRHITTIPNGLPERCFKQPLGFHRPGRGPTTFAAILNGGFSGRKNGPALLQAFQQLRSQGVPARLILYGAGSGPGEEGEVHSLRLGGLLDTEFRGFVPHSEVLRCLAEEVDVLVHPSLEESFGNPIMEAMAQGLPVIAGQASGGVSEILQEGRTGLLVDVRSPEAMTQAMARLHREPALRAKLGRTALLHCRETFHIQAVLARYQALYEQILPPTFSLTGDPR